MVSTLAKPQVLIDGRSIRVHPSGVGLWNLYLTSELLRRGVLIELLIPQKHDFNFSTDPRFSPYLSKGTLRLHPSPFPYEFIGLRRLWTEQIFLSRLIRKIKPDIYHATDSFGVPFFLSRSVKCILTIHDLIPLTPWREYFGFGDFGIYKFSLARSIKRADQIVAISAHTKRDIQHLGINPKKSVRIISNGGGEKQNFSRQNLKTVWEQFKLKYVLEENNFLFYYGGFGRRRNIGQLISIFNALLKEGVLTKGAKLVLAGRLKKAKPDIYKNLQILNRQIQLFNLEDRVIFLDFLSDIEKTALTQKCLLFLWLSIYEGFGLPPFEVLAYRKKIILTRVGAWYAYPDPSIFIVDNPLSLSESLTKIKKILTASVESQEFKNILKFAHGYSWAKMGGEYTALYQEILNAKI